MVGIKDESKYFEAFGIEFNKDTIYDDSMQMCVGGNMYTFTTSLDIYSYAFTGGMEKHYIRFSERFIYIDCDTNPI